MRSKLREAYLSARERAAILAGEISAVLPTYTAHDVRHSDAFWRLATTILGDGKALTPLEAFVFGVSSLIHDLGMGLAAYPGGEASLRADPRWKDAIAARITSEFSRAPTPAELKKPPERIIESVREELLRALHAEKAGELASTAWQDASTGQMIYLVDDADLRMTYGELIGRIAASHHWDIDQLQDQFGQLLGTWPGFPSTWIVDPLKLACLIRVVDAAQLDARRAPRFLRAIRPIVGISAAHWAFQEHLLEPVARDGRLEFTSAVAFKGSESEAWWLCFDMLKEIVDVELRGVDALLADTGRERFAIRAVAGVEDARRLARLIRTDGWVPIDCQVRVSNVAGLVAKLGGEALYGENPLVALRELIQNAADAVRARRYAEQLPGDWGDIFVRTGDDPTGPWIEVEDTGIGMSEAVLSGALLDFGVSYWGSQIARVEHVGLASSGFQPEGRYGIGFFAVFMVGQRVVVRSRPSEQGWAATKVLEFPKGVESRPILRPATTDEVLRHGGTAVRVYLRRGSVEPSGIFEDNSGREHSVILAQIAPTLPVNLWLCESGAEDQLCVKANDWIVMPGEDLLRRLWGADDLSTCGISPPDFAILAANLRPILDETGAVVARATVWRGGVSLNRRRTDMLGVVSCGGLASSTLIDIQGVFKGVPRRAARDLARPIASGRGLARWATEQAMLPAPSKDPRGNWRMNDAAVIRSCGGSTGHLPIAFSDVGALDMRGLQNWLRTTSVVSFVGLYEPYGDRDIEQYGFKLRRGFLATELRPQALLREAPDYLLRVDTDFENRWPPPRTRPRRSHEDWIASFLDGSLLLLVLEIAAKAWSTSVEALLANGEGSLFGEKLREVIGTDIQGDVEGNVEARIYAPV